MLYYIHGYQSSTSSEKALLLKETLQVIPVQYRDVPPEELVIPQCLSRISQAISHDPTVVLIGSSLGGFLAAATALTHPNVKQLILLNPAIIPPEIDLNTIQGMPQRILKDMISPKLFTKKLAAQITILRGAQDDIVPDEWVVRFAQAQHATIQLFDDDHRFSKNLSRLPYIISEIIRI
jgi:predicted esterase YcpF (UPF0227 family)